MKALLLVGGLGTRLRPLTYTRPKALLPLGNSTLVEHVINGLKACHVREIVLAGGYKLNMFEAVLGKGERLEVALEYSSEPQPLGTAGPIRQAETYLGGTGAFLVLNGDIVTDMNYRALVAFHQRRKARATLALHRVGDPSRYGVVELSAGGCIRTFTEKPATGIQPNNLINAGCYVLDEDVLNMIPPGKASSIEREVFPSLCTDGRVYGWEHKGLWVDTGTPESYLEANHAVLAATLGKRRGSPLPRALPYQEMGLKPPVVMGDGVQVDSSSMIGPDVTLGQRVTVEAKACLRDAIIFDDAVIGSEAVVEHSVVGQGAVIGKGIRLEGLALVGDEATIEAGSQVPAGARVPPHSRIRSGTSLANLRS